MSVNDVVQFNKNHRLSGCLGVIRNVKKIKNDIRYMVELSSFKQPRIFLLIMKNENVIEKIGKSKYKNDY